MRDRKRGATVDERLVIRDMTEPDSLTISRAFQTQGWNKSMTQYQEYWEQMELGSRTVLVAEQSEQFAGYLTIKWQSGHPPFRENRTPEIADLNVLIRCRRRGIGTALMDAAESRIGSRSGVAGIGVGMTEDYGAAQIMYAKRGYTPDGRGLWYRDRQLSRGDTALVDDDLVLYFTKDLRMGTPSRRA